MARRLVVVPTDPIEAYERKGTSSWLESYYNPKKMFDEVYALSPMEKGQRNAYGMTIIGVNSKSFVKYLRELKPDIVRAYGGFWPADFVCLNRISGIPVVVSVHDTTNIHRSVRYADMVICMSEVVKQKVLDQGVSPQRIRIMPNRVNLDIFHPITDLTPIQTAVSKFPPGKHILHVGRKTEAKNIDTVLRSLKFLPEDYSCIFVGHGDTSPYLKLAKEIGVDNRCFWIDSIKNSELPLWYSWCDCMCVPSRWEGFGLVFIEAAACGAGIVTSDIAPMNEYLTNNESAVLVKEYENPKVLAAAIQKVCEDDEFRKRISKGALSAALPFDKSVIDNFESEIYHEVMSLPSPSFKRRLEIKTWQMAFKTRVSLTNVKSQMSNVNKHCKLGIKKYIPFLVPPLKKIKSIMSEIQLKILRLRNTAVSQREPKDKIDRNQWTPSNNLNVYRNYMVLSWEETAKYSPQYFERLKFSVSKAQGLVLEVGCGIGTMTRWLADSPQVKEVIAVDVFEEAINELKAYALPKVTPMKIDLGTESINYKYRFDTVVICEVLEHLYLEEEINILKNLRAFIDAHTRYVISVPIGWLPDPHHVREFSKEAFKQHLQEFYGDPVEIDYSSGYSQVAWGYFKAQCLEQNLR